MGSMLLSLYVCNLQMFVVSLLLVSLSSVSYQCLTKLECWKWDKHSILFPKFVNYGQKSFITLAPGVPAGRKPYN